MEALRLRHLFAILLPRCVERVSVCVCVRARARVCVPVYVWAPLGVNASGAFLFVCFLLSTHPNTPEIS